jgi:hypothetical protein
MCSRTSDFLALVPLHHANQSSMTVTTHVILSLDHSTSRISASISPDSISLFLLSISSINPSRENIVEFLDAVQYQRGNAGFAHGAALGLTQFASAIVAAISAFHGVAEQPDCKMCWCSWGDAELGPQCEVLPFQLDS